MVALPPAIQEKYGDLYVGENWRSAYQNIRTGSMMNRSHKCGVCGGPVTKACYESLHNAFCLTIVKDKNGREVICGERFCVVSPKGCVKHPFSGGIHGYNREVQRLAKGLAIDWGRLQEKDPDYFGDNDNRAKVEPVINDWVSEPWRLYNERNAQLSYLNSQSYRKHQLEPSSSTSSTVDPNNRGPQIRAMTEASSSKKPLRGYKAQRISDPQAIQSQASRRGDILVPTSESKGNLKVVRGNRRAPIDAVTETPEEDDEAPRPRKAMKAKPSAMKKFEKFGSQR
ncbi:hypothetical protein BDV96DRAFT_687805 [Lophiotrema nucula]|uniref:Uncharacterized protein n=1 Tax=Lophiotrema nucula TaxID=690887 RepID=A0A6A5Z7Q6_9PLEO|nr:hypothetical protein BDV96DRAFT_687805 [Lophiotrema nucula]